MRLIDELGLCQAIYTDPARTDLPGPALSKWNIAYGLLHQLSLDKSPGSIYNVLVKTKDESYFAWALASLTPFAHAVDPRGRVKGKEPLPVATTVARAGARAPNKLCDIITAAAIHQSEIRCFKDDICKSREVSAQRDVLGMAIRAWDARDTYWRVQVLYAILVDAMDNLDYVPTSDSKQCSPQEPHRYISRLIFLIWPRLSRVAIPMAVVPGPPRQSRPNGSPVAAPTGGRQNADRSAGCQAREMDGSSSGYLPGVAA